MNDTKVALRFSVTSAGVNAITTVAAGSSAEVEVSQTGPYTVGLMNSEQWRILMEAAREDLVSRLASPDNLTPTEIVANIDALTTRIDALLRNPVGATCSGRVTTKLDGEATASGSSTAPKLACAGVPAADPGFFDIPFIGSPF